MRVEAEKELFNHNINKAISMFELAKDINERLYGINSKEFMNFFNKMISSLNSEA